MPERYGLGKSGIVKAEWAPCEDHRKDIPLWARTLTPGYEVISEINWNKQSDKGGPIRQGLYLPGSDDLEESDWQFGPETHKRLGEKNSKGQEELFGEWNSIYPVQVRDDGYWYLHDFKKVDTTFAAFDSPPAINNKDIPYGITGAVVKCSDYDEYQEIFIPVQEITVAQEKSNVLHSTLIYATGDWNGKAKSAEEYVKPEFLKRENILDRDALNRTRAATTSSQWWIKENDEKYYALALNFRKATHEKTGWGFYVGEGQVGQNVVKKSLILQHGPKIETEYFSFSSVNDRRKQTKKGKDTNAYLSVKKGGPNQAGHEKLDKHQIAINSDKEAINSGHIDCIEGLYYYDVVFDGPINFQARSMPPRNHFAYRAYNHIVFDMELEYHHYTGNHQGMWDVYSEVPYIESRPPEKPPWTPDEPPITPRKTPNPVITPGPKDTPKTLRPVDSHYAFGNAGKLERASTIDRFGDWRERIKMEAEIDDEELSRELARIRETNPNGYWTLPPAMLWTTNLVRWDKSKRDYYYTQNPYDRTWIDGGTAEGTIYFTPAEFMGDTEIPAGTPSTDGYSQMYYGWHPSIIIGWGIPDNSNLDYRHDLRRDGAIFTMTGASGSRDLDLYFYDAATPGSTRQGTFTVHGNIAVTGPTCGWWTRDSGNTKIYPSQAGDDIWLPDDDSIAFGNTTASPDASVYWDSAGNYLRIRTPATGGYGVWHEETQTADTHTYRLYLKHTKDVTAGDAKNHYNIRNYQYLYGGNNYTGLHSASYNFVLNYNTATVSKIYAVSSILTNQNAGTITRGIGYSSAVDNKVGGIISTTEAAYGYIQNSGGGTISNAYGARYKIINNSTGTIGAAYAYRAEIYNNDAGGTITDAYGLHVESPVNAGTITNYYGAKIDDPNGAATDPTNAWPIYVEDTTLESYMGGHYRLLDDRELRFGATSGGDASLSWISASNKLKLDLTTNAGDYLEILTTNTGRVEISDGNTNIFIGKDSGINRDSAAQYNVAIGDYTMGAGGTFTGDYNTAIGDYALSSVTSGYGNVGVGYYSLLNDTTGYYNTGVGVNAGRGITTSYFASAFGWGAMYYSGAYNYSVAFGARSMQHGSSYSVAVGNQAMRNNTGGYNTAMGYQALYNGDGQYNAAVGIAAGYGATGDRCVFLGAYAGRYETGSGKLFIHSYSETDEATSRVNSIIYGEMVNANPSAQNLYVNADLHLKHDNMTLYLGAGDDFYLTFDGTNGVIKSTSGDINITAATGFHGINHGDPDYTLDVNGCLALRDQSGIAAPADSGTIAIGLSDGSAADEYDEELRYALKDAAGNSSEGIIRKYRQEYHSTTAGGGNATQVLCSVGDLQNVGIELVVEARHVGSPEISEYREWRVWGYRNDTSGVDGVSTSAIATITVGAYAGGCAIAYNAANDTIDLTMNADADAAGSDIRYKVKWSINILEDAGE